MAKINTFKNFIIGGNAMHKEIGLVQIIDYYKKLDIAKVKIDCSNSYYNTKSNTLLVPLEFLAPCT